MHADLQTDGQTHRQIHSHPSCVRDSATRRTEAYVKLTHTHHFTVPPLLGLVSHPVHLPAVEKAA